VPGNGGHVQMRKVGKLCLITKSNKAIILNVVNKNKKNVNKLNTAQ